MIIQPWQNHHHQAASPKPTNYSGCQVAAFFRVNLGFLLALRRFLNVTCCQFSKNMCCPQDLHWVPKNFHQPPLSLHRPAPGRSKRHVSARLLNGDRPPRLFGHSKCLHMTASSRKVRGRWPVRMVADTQGWMELEDFHGILWRCHRDFPGIYHDDSMKTAWDLHEMSKSGEISRKQLQPND